MSWGVLTLLFGDVSYVVQGRRHFFGYTYGDQAEIGAAPVGLKTSRGVMIGSRVVDVTAAYPAAQINPEDDFTPPFFFVNDSLRGFLTGVDDDATVTAILGGDDCGICRSEIARPVTLYDLHETLAWFLVLANAAVGVWALAAHVRAGAAGAPAVVGDRRGATVGVRHRHRRRADGQPVRPRTRPVPRAVRLQLRSSPSASSTATEAARSSRTRCTCCTAWAACSSWASASGRMYLGHCQPESADPTPWGSFAGSHDSCARPCWQANRSVIPAT